MRSMCVWVTKLAGVLRAIDPQVQLTITTDVVATKSSLRPSAEALRGDLEDAIDEFFAIERTLK